MDKCKLLFNKEYEDYYKMVEENKIFSKYCIEVFGIDFSQDGYSDLGQVKDLIKKAEIKKGHKVLDIGCGNGKMVEYIADQTGAEVYGFDYSENAIKYARLRTEKKKNLFFDEGCIGEKQYEAEFFDVIISVDTMYFALDMESFVQQVCGWLKPGGIFAIYYEEGHLKGISDDSQSTELALALTKSDMKFDAVDYTKQHYELMKHKREIITKAKDSFLENDMEFYYLCAMDTSIDPEMNLEEFRKHFNRYLYIARKQEAKTKEEKE